MVIFHSYVSLPEGKFWRLTWLWFQCPNWCLGDVFQLLWMLWMMGRLDMCSWLNHGSWMLMETWHHDGWNWMTINLSCWWISNDCLRAQPSKLQSKKVISNEWHFQMNCIVFILCQTSVTLNTKLLWLSLTVVDYCSDNFKFTIVSPG